MKRRLAVVLLGITIFLPLVSACGKKNEASKAAAESEKTEKEGKGEETDAEETETEAPETVTEEPDRIVILFPGDSGDKRWASDADEMQNAFLAAGYESTVLYADGDAGLQSRQVSEAAEEHTVAMVIAPEDPYGLSDVLSAADEAKIPVFDYDELIMDTEAIDYFVTFDNREAGHQMAKKVSEDNSLERHKEGEPALTAGYLMETDKVSSLFLYNGLLEELGQYYEAGALASASGEAFDQASLVDQARSAEESEEESLPEAAPDILCVSGPESARIAEEAGTPDMYVIAGDSSAETVQAAADGIIDAFVFRDNRILARKCAETVLAYLAGEDIEVSNYGDYDNGIRTVRAITCEEQTFDRSNFEALLDSGYFSENEIRVQEEETPAEETGPADNTARPTGIPEGRTEARPGADRL